MYMYFISLVKDTNLIFYYLVLNNNLKNWKIMQLLNIYNQSHAWKKDIFKVLWFYVKNYESLIRSKKSDILELLNNTMVLHQNHGFIWKIMQLLNIYNQSHVWKKDIFKVLWFCINNYERLIHYKTDFPHAHKYFYGLM